MNYLNPSRETKFFSGANGDREIFIFFPVQLTTTSRIGNIIQLIHTESLLLYYR